MVLINIKLENNINIVWIKSAMSISSSISRTGTSPRKLYGDTFMLPLFKNITTQDIDVIEKDLQNLACRDEKIVCIVIHSDENNVTFGGLIKRHQNIEYNIKENRITIFIRNPNLVLSL